MEQARMKEQVDANLVDIETEATDVQEAEAPRTPERQEPDLGLPDSASSHSVRILTEHVDVYLLTPEEDREIELKDFTIMKPKNNKMHRLVRYYPHCEIQYNAVPGRPVEEKIVTSPNGTNTTMIIATQRHNGGFSNPSRNAEVFKLKRRLLKEYYASITKDPSFLVMDDETMDARGMTSIGSSRSTPRRHGGGGLNADATSPGSPWSLDGYSRTLSPSMLLPLSMIPKYERVPIGDEDTVQLTSEMETKLSWRRRMECIDSLWPEIAPMDDDSQIMDYYGLEVQIITEDERKKDLAAHTEPINDEKEEASMTYQDIVDEAALHEQENELSDEPMLLPLASKQDDWVQCDRCQKWRRLPNSVNVSELPATWYCSMNRWDKRFNKCSDPEEQVVVPARNMNDKTYRERRFVQEFGQRFKRMDKALLQYKYTDTREDPGERQVVQCVECFKLRPLIGGMDPAKISQPFVCWKNTWDELHASCSAPQGPIAPRQYESFATPRGTFGGSTIDDPTLKHMQSATSSQTNRVSGSSGPGSGTKKSSKNTSNTNKPKSMKRKASAASTISNGSDTTANTKRAARK